LVTLDNCCLFFKQGLSSLNSKNSGELRIMGVNKGTAKRYYDPELISLLLTALAALGSTASIVGGILAIIEHSDSKKEKQAWIEEKWHYRNSIREEIRYTIHSLSRSVDNIDYELRTLEDIYHMSKKANADLVTRFGNGSMWLERYQFERFYRTQTRVVEETRNIYSSLKLIEELLLAGENDSLVLDLGYNVKVRRILEDETAPVNHLISRFGEISIEKFVAESIEICHHIRNIIKHLEDNLRRNYM